MGQSRRHSRSLRSLERVSVRVRALLSDPVRRFQLSLAFLLSFMLIGIGGFMFLENLDVTEALYMTVITVTTVGFGDIVPRTDAGRLFTMVLLFLGIGAATSAVSNALGILLGDRLWLAVRERRMEESLQLMENHYVVAGFGRIGRQIVRDILARGEQCVVIDQDVRIQTEEMLVDFGVPFVIGDATEDTTLAKTGIERARGFVAALDSDADNVLAILTARGINNRLYVVARASVVQSESKLRRAGADHVVSPHQIGGHRMAMALLRPSVHRFLSTLFDVSDEGSYDIGEIDVVDRSRLVGQTVATSDLRAVRDLSIVAIVTVENELIINPSSKYTFRAGDRLIVIGPPKSLYRLEDIHDFDDD